MNNKYILVKKNDFRGENLFLSFLDSESDEQVFDVQCDETFSNYINHDFKNNLFFYEHVDFQIYKKEIGYRIVKDERGIPIDYHKYFQNFAKLK